MTSDVPFAYALQRIKEALPFSLFFKEATHSVTQGFSAFVRPPGGLCSFCLHSEARQARGLAAAARKQPPATSHGEF